MANYRPDRQKFNMHISPVFKLSQCGMSFRTDVFVRDSWIQTETKNNVAASGEWERRRETRLSKLCYFNCLFLGVGEVHCCSLPSRRFVRQSSEEVKHWSVSTSNGACYLGYENSQTDRGTQREFSGNICSEYDLRSRIFETFFVKFLACLLLLGFSNI